MIALTPDQQKAHDAAVSFIRNGGATYLTIGGYAGTGKSVTLAEIVRTIRKTKNPPEIAFCCYTGKAAAVVREKLSRAGLQENRDYKYCGTIHGLIYQPIVDHEGTIVGWDRVSSIPADILVIDEASMVNGEIWQDLKSYGLPILAVGDHGQLPPIEGAFNLMEKPDHVLTKIHRQAEDSPIIKLSERVRNGEEIAYGSHGKGVYKTAGTNEKILERQFNLGSTLFLSGLNRTRRSVNKAVRRMLGYLSPHPEIGETVICLRNNRKERIFNGMTGKIMDIADLGGTFYGASILMDGGLRFNGRLVQAQFGAENTLRNHPELEPFELKELFDWGYCLTVHKSQGSEADYVVLFEERSQFMDDDTWRRWLYTAVTRAKKNLLVVNRRFDLKQPKREIQPTTAT